MKKYKEKNTAYRLLWKSFICIALSALGFSSCVEEHFQMYDGLSDEGEEITVPAFFSVAPMVSVNPKTRAEEYIEATADEKNIHDFWIIEYNEKGTRVGLPRYYEIQKDGSIGENLSGSTTPVDSVNFSNGSDYIARQEINILVPREGQGDFTCVVIANTNDRKMFNAENRSQFSTLDDLRRFSTAAHNQETIFNPKEGKYLLMSGWTTISTDQNTRELSFQLIRNVSKVRVELNDFPYYPDNEAASKIYFKYFQWRDVPLGKVFPHGDVGYHQPVSRDWRQHEEEDLVDENGNIIEKGAFNRLKDGIDFYLPSNVWLQDGPMMSSDTDSGSKEIEEDPTHFSIVCRKIDGWRIDDDGKRVPRLSDDQYELRTFPSKDVNTQFRFELNHCYKIDISVTGLPPEDGEYVKVIGYKQLEESNCYMIKRDSKDIFAVPLTRINKFWTSEDVDESDRFELEDETEWIAEVIWQDTPLRIIDFASYGGFEAATDHSYLEGCGNTGFAFRPTGTGEGNVIVGVRKRTHKDEETPPVDKREYLWSWHLWITDYAPDELDDDGPYNWYYKEVPGGAVHRYPTIEYWQTDGASQYIMDRDLGAKSTFDKTDVLDDMIPYMYSVDSRDWGYRFHDVFPTFGLYYQYGRKDPFPYSEGAYPDNPKDDEKNLYPKGGIQMVYDINGNVIPAFSQHTTMILSKPNEGSFENAVMHPYVFYTISPAARFWHDTGVGADEEVPAWLSPDWNDLETGKSVYDPCPPGWRVIPNVTVYGDWQHATLQDRVHHYQEPSRFRLGCIIDLGDGHNAFYPASGRRDGVYGKIDYESDKEDESEYKHYFRYWTFSGLSEWWLESGDFDEGNFDDGDKTNVFSLSNWNYTTGEPSGTGLSIRCIRDVLP